MLTSALVLSALLPLVPAETVLGVYLFHRHGDRTSKSFPPASLTDLGYQEVWQSGNFYRNRYIDANASSPIFGIASNVVKNTQLNVQAPVDTVLQNSASGFLQGLYPPVGGMSNCPFYVGIFQRNRVLETNSWSMFRIMSSGNISLAVAATSLTSS